MPQPWAQVRCGLGNLCRSQQRDQRGREISVQHALQWGFCCGICTRSRSNEALCFCSNTCCNVHALSSDHKQRVLCTPSGLLLQEAAARMEQLVQQKVLPAFLKVLPEPVRCEDGEPDPRQMAVLVADALAYRFGSYKAGRYLEELLSLSDQQSARTFLSARANEPVQCRHCGCTLRFLVYLVRSCLCIWRDY